MGDRGTTSEPFAEVGKVLVFRVVFRFRLLLRVEVVQVPKELVETVHRRQVVVAVAQMVLAKLTRLVALVLERRGDGRDRSFHSLFSTGHADLGEPGTQAVLAGDEAGASGGARLLGVVVGEKQSLLGNGVNVGRFVSHHALCEDGEIRLP